MEQKLQTRGLNEATLEITRILVQVQRPSRVKVTLIRIPITVTHIFEIFNLMSNAIFI